MPVVRNNVLEKARKIVMSAMINLAKYYVLEECTKDVIKLLENADPESIWEMVESDYRLINAIDDEWNKKINKVVGIIKLKKLEKEALELIDKIDARTVIEYLAEEVKGNEKAMDNLMFICSSPKCYAWLCRNIDDVRQYVKSKIV